MKLKRVLKGTIGILIAFMAIGGVLYLLGVRIVLDGGGGPHVAFVKSLEQRAEELAKHREAQRAQPPETGATPVLPPTTATEESAPAAPAKPVSSYWTEFRGPQRDGHYRQQPIRTDWPKAGLKPLWKQPVGGGYASFVVSGGRAFSIEQRGRQEVAAAYDLETGRELWTNSWEALFQEPMGGDGPRATPTWHDGRLFVLGAAGELRALDAAAGRMLWRTNILDDAGASNIQWGMSAAPLVVGTTVVVLPGGPKGNSIVAYDIATGKRAWGALDDRASYSSPMLVTLDGVPQVLTFTATRLVALSPNGNELLWEFPWTTQYEVNASQPLVVGANRVFVSTGYGTGAALLELSRGADRKFAVREVWRTNRMKNQFSSSVLHDGFIYGLDESILACLDATTGELKWKGGRYGYGQIMLASGHLIVLTEQGELALVRADPGSHQELARFPVIDGKTWNHPAISDGLLLIRNLNEMAALDLRVKGTK